MPGREKPGDQVVAVPFAGKEWKGRQSLAGNPRDAKKMRELKPERGSPEAPQSVV